MKAASVSYNQSSANVSKSIGPKEALPVKPFALAQSETDLPQRKQALISVDTNLPKPQRSNEDIYLLLERLQSYEPKSGKPLNLHVTQSHNSSVADHFPHTASGNEFSQHGNTTNLNVLDQSQIVNKHNQTDSFDKRRISTLHDNPKKPAFEVAARAFRNSPTRYANYFEPIRGLEAPLRTERNIRATWDEAVYRNKLANDGYYGTRVQQTEVPRNNNSSITPKQMTSYSSSSGQQFADSSANIQFNFLTDGEGL